MRVRFTVLERSDAALTLERIELPNGAVARLTGETKSDPTAGREPLRARLEANRPLIAEAEIPLPVDAPLTQPYWLRVPALKGSFQVAEQALIGAPENPPALSARAANSE